MGIPFRGRGTNSVRRVLIILLVAASSLPFGCGGPSEDSRSDTGPSQSNADIGGAGPDAGLDGGAAPDAGVPPLAFAPCGDGLECAAMTVPLDYAAVESGTVELAVTRRPAADPARRIGVVVIGFGGPGAPARFALRQPQVNAILALAPDLRNRFDLVGLDWRGVGESRPAFGCGNLPFLERAAALYDEAPPANDDEIAAIDAKVAALIGDCAATNDPGLAAHADTESSARDMELLRAALGEEKLNYLGLSFGTWLGATYATLFPGRVRAFVLDSPLAPTLPFSSGGLELTRRMAAAREESLSRWFDWCASNAGCAFQKGRDVAGIARAFDDLVAELKSSPLPSPDQDDHTVTGYVLFNAAINLLYTKSWSQIGTLLAAAAEGDSSGFASDNAYPPEVTINMQVSLSAIRCLDFPAPEGFMATGFGAFSDELVQANPHTGLMTALDVIQCAHWPVRLSAPPTPIHAPGAPPMLVVVTRHDPAVGYAQAQVLIDALGNGSKLLTFEGDGHGAISNSIDCAFPAEIAFLVNPRIAPPTTCP